METSGETSGETPMETPLISSATQADTMAAVPAALEAVDVRKSLPLGRERIEILRGISLRIGQGEFVALMGPSGSGKSTLLGILAGLDTPTSGGVLVDGVEIARMGEARLATIRNEKIGMVFQAFNLIPTLTALENVEAPLYLGRRHANPTGRARELLALVGVAHRASNRPSQLSGGEQQRVAIARALAPSPAIVIMDEPTGNLDQKNGDLLVGLIRELRAATGTTFLIATHDPRIAAAADRTLTIVDGSLSPQPRSLAREGGANLSPQPPSLAREGGAKLSPQPPSLAREGGDGEGQR